jgi:hypothetical protein
MARSIKTQGMVELDALRKRVRRQLALRRIRPDDCDWLVTKLNEVEAYIVKMDEKGEQL